SYRRTATEGVDRLLSKSLPGLADADRDALRMWAETLANRLAHVPSVGLRDLAVAAGSSAVEAFFETSDPVLRQLFATTAARPASEVLEPELIES
ncbi:MAG TPA: hypothetical protein VII82_15455, partial [Polyangiaceae bacterium]